MIDLSCAAAVASACRYHSHFGNQYVDGIKGVFVVNDPTSTTAYAESVLQVTDW